MKNTWIGSILLLFLILPLAGQTTQEKFRLVHSDKLFLTKVLDEQVMELSGKVHFWYGETEFKSDRALIFDQQKIVRLDGRVNVVNDSLSMRSDSLSYYRNKGELNAGGNVYIVEERKSGSFRWFRCQKAIYKQDIDQLTVWENVSSYDKEENATLTCGYAHWDRKNGYAYMIENPKVRTAQQDTLNLSAEKIEYFAAEKKIVATFNVQAESRDYRTKSDFLLYFLDEDKAVFTGEPYFYSAYATASAREFYLYFNERSLERAELVDSCLVRFSDKSGGEQSNWVRSNFLALGFSEDMIDDFHAENSVSYHYRQEKNEKNDFFINEASGEMLDAKFGSDNKLERMFLKQGIKGIYKFHNRS